MLIFVAAGVFVAVVVADGVGVDDDGDIIAGIEGYGVFDGVVCGGAAVVVGVRLCYHCC